MTRTIEIVLVALVLVVVPIAVGIAAGFRVRPADSYRQAAVLAGICCRGNHRTYALRHKPGNPSDRLPEHWL
jgi:hypothetical protein